MFEQLQLHRIGKTIALNVGIVGATVASVCLSALPAAWALPEEDVLKKLEQVPTFTLINENGNLLPLQFVPEGQSPQETQPLPWFFLSPEAANTTLNTLQQKNPELKDKIQVFPVQMSRVYELMKQVTDENSDEPNLVLMPILQEVQTAWELLKQEGAKIDNPEQVGIPLFFARIGEDSRFMTLQSSQNEPFIPFYWQKEQVQADIELYKKQDAAAASETFKIQVIPLHRFISFLLENDDPAAQLMRIIPSAQQIDTANQILESTQSAQQPSEGN